MSGDPAAGDPRPFARLLAGLSDHREEALRASLLARRRVELAALQDAEAAIAERRARGEPALLEQELLARGLIDELDVAAAFAAAAPAAAGPRYELGERLGEGAAGVVYRARDRVLGRFVAIKVLKPGAGSGADSRDSAAAALGEGEALARLQHPNLVTVYDAGVLDGRPFVATEWIEGRTFAAHLAERSRSLRELVQNVAEAARGLGAAHRLGIVHRDVKPGNLLVDAAGVARVCDFGCAVAAATAGAGSAGSAGTPRFMAPEQFDAAHGPLGPATDVYGLGAVLYQVLVGAPPFAGLDGDALRAAVRGGEPPAPHRLVRVPRDLSAVALRALCRAPAGRYRDGDDFAADLEAWLRGDPVRARTAPAAVRLWRAVRRHPARAIAASVAVAALVAALAVQQAARERRALHAQLFDRLQRSAELGLDAMLRLRRVGDVAGMAELARPVAAACAEALAAFPDEGRPHLVLARLRRTTMEFAAARHHVDLAAARLPDDPDVRYERALLALHFALVEQQRRREEAQRDDLWRGATGWARARWAAMRGDPQALDRAIVDAAAADLRASGRPFARSLAEALAGPSLLAGFDPSTVPPEANRDAEVFAWLAAAAMRRGEHETARQQATLGIESDRGYAPHLLLRATATFRAWTALAAPEATSLAAVHAGLVADLAAAVRLRPADAELHERAAVLLLLVADEARRTAATLAPDPLTLAIGHLEQATALGPDSADRWHGLAVARLDALAARGFRSAGGDEVLGQALADLGRALALDGERPALHESLGHARLAALRRARSRADRAQPYQHALAAFAASRQLAPRHFGPRLGMAMSHQLAGRRDLAIAELEAAIAELPEARPMLEPTLARLKR